MPKNKDFTHRIEILDECFRNRLRKWTLQNLIDTVNDKLQDHGKSVKRRTIQDDIRYLKEEMNAPVAKTKNGSDTYFFYEDPDFSIKNLPVQQEELDRLKDAVHILRQVNGFKILKEVDDIITKLEHTISVGEQDNPYFLQLENHTIASGAEHIDVILTAIKEKVALRITYQSFKADGPQETIFHAYLLKEYRNRWFVIGRKDDNAYITVYALDRITQIRNSSANYTENNLFDPATYYNNVIGVTTPMGKEVVEIEILVAAKQVPYIRTKPIHHSQQIIETYENGDLLIRLWLIENYELRSVLLSYGCDLQVLKPASLRDEIRLIFQQGFECYGKNDA
jgi:predicted DNA-binding transcriptional regulator YafY